MDPNATEKDPMAEFVLNHNQARLGKDNPLPPPTPDRLHPNPELAAIGVFWDGVQWRIPRANIHKFAAIRRRALKAGKASGLQSARELPANLPKRTRV
jgi:hypothetical protein